MSVTMDAQVKAVAAAEHTWPWSPLPGKRMLVPVFQPGTTLISRVSCAHCASA